MSHASNQEIDYSMRLEPLHSDWRITQERSVNYESLPSGEYHFHLKAKDGYGNVVEAAPIHFEIRKAFWRTAWFIFLIICLLVGLITWYYKRRERLHLEELEEEKHINQRMAELELSALRAQMNPHFVFNALGAIQYYIQTQEVETADNYLTQFARLMRKYLESSKEKMIPLSEEIELLTIYTDLEQLRFEGLFAVDIQIESDLQLEDCYVPSMLIQPYIENAINHGLNERRDKEGKLSIRFSRDNSSLICEIRDNGIGRKNAKKFRRKGHKSRGMQIIKDRIHTLKNSGLAEVKIEVQDLYTHKEDYPGTYVKISIQNLEYEYM